MIHAPPLPLSNFKTETYKSMSPPPTQPAPPPPGRSTNPFDDDDDSDYDDETISRMLDNMDIDADFNCWTSFRASMSIKSKNSIAAAKATASSGTFDAIGKREEEEALTQSERAYIDKWSRRVDREKVYSRTYRPVPREERELKDLSAFLGVTGGGSTAKQSGGGLLDKMNMGNLKHERASRGTADRSAVLKLLFPLPDEEKSVLLKRGPVLMRKRGQVNYEERELILLSRGLIIATPLHVSAAEVADVVAGESSPANQQKKPGPERKMPSGLTKIPSGLVNGLARIPSGLGKKVIHRHFESAVLLTSLGVEDLTTSKESNSFAIFVDKDASSASTATRFVFTCAKLPQKEAWVTALEKAQYYTKIGDRDNAVGDRARAAADNAPGGMPANAMSRNMAALQERGDKLEKLDHRTADLEGNAAEYRETARQLKEKAKKQTVFGL